MNRTPASAPELPAYLTLDAVRADVRRALDEDVGAGDLTAALVPAEAQATAHVIAREAATLAGRPWFDAVFAALDPAIAIDWAVREGEAVSADQRLCTLTGPAAPLLTGERTALNFLQTLSAVATAARRYADAVAGTGVAILDTRKTLPGLRLAQKYAVLCGGCRNHRLGLYDAVLIKENHIAAAGSIAQAVRAARAAAGGRTVEVEVENLAELREALDAGADIVLLDNMDLATLREAVALTGARAKLEISGGVTLETVREFAQTGVDYISVGALTKHVQAVDLSMRFTSC
ncbi:carboxylating nicotinate-nucleotide diphosphorylase [Ectothiorhodospiraceae bacterium 2226]|nr:carboxylating nicotinate-nucleotide diphosphorylase [Ectothiorhodospiraceae bacterium 2226]